MKATVEIVKLGSDVVTTSCPTQLTEEGEE